MLVDGVAGENPKGGLAPFFMLFWNKGMLWDFSFNPLCVPSKQRTHANVYYREKGKESFLACEEAIVFLMG